MTNRIEQFIGIWDRKIPSDLCAEIIRYHLNDPNRKPGVIGNADGLGNPGVNMDLKRSFDSEFDIRNCPEIHQSVLPFLRECLDDYLFAYPDADAVHQFQICEWFLVQQYLPGGAYFRRHCERSEPLTSDRHLAFMVYLNTVTDEGGTAFPNQNLVLGAEEGRVVIWPSDWTHAHYGIPSPSQAKFIITGWYSYLSPVTSTSDLGS